MTGKDILRFFSPQRLSATRRSINVNIACHCKRYSHSESELNEYPLHSTHAIPKDFSINNYNGEEENTSDPKFDGKKYPSTLFGENRIGIVQLPKPLVEVVADILVGEL